MLSPLRITMPRTIKKPTVRRAEILKTARDLFLKKDYDKTTMQDFMNQLGIAKGTIYHYFKSKEELLEAVIEDIVTEHLLAMETVMHEVKGNVLDKMEALVKAGRIRAPFVLEQLHDRSNE